MNISHELLLQSFVDFSTNYKYSVIYEYNKNNDLTGYIVGGPNFGSFGIVIKTTNGGTTWLNVPISTNGSLYGAYFINSNTGIVLGSGHTI